MLTWIWENLLYGPLLNALAFLISIVPGGDVGIAVILLTILVRVILLPLSARQIKSQAAMNKLAPEISKIKQSNKNKEEQARATFDLYRENKVNPFSGCLFILVQIPIIFALYFVFFKGMSFNGNLYSFINVPANLNMNFLGFMNIAEKSLILAVLAGASQFFQARLMPSPPNSGGGNSFAESFSKSMQMQMRYVFPFIVGFIAYGISGAVALYWTTSNTFSIFQQLYFNKKSKADE